MSKKSNYSNNNSNFTYSDKYNSGNIQEYENDKSRSNIKRFNHDLSLLSKTYSSIKPKKMGTESSTNSRGYSRSLVTLSNAISNIPYQNKSEIDIIQIKDKNYYISGNKIEFYKFDDTKFNKCKKCKNKENKFFCDNCLINICEICLNKCAFNKHELINLEEKLKEADNYKLEVNKIIRKSFIEPKSIKLKDDSGIEKKEVTYELMDDNEMYSGIDEPPMEYTDDISLVESIIDKNYFKEFSKISLNPINNLLINFFKHLN